ncbi:serine/threonine-protein kinase PLK4 isoform X2 [Copidosoma floridanum]|uniref:serine/threonine-protein kinase PLK4 isoform X2 n=1 Tax=Copidosoma floridanum TaxID=29053 RepID=UPI000C6F77DB|nr:serine/threonine-protein kinase PLK4 isoform X2 [Copidosoma floridanum]
MPAFSSGGFGENIEEYQVLNLLGKGGFASVYKAKCLRTGLEVAIKMIDKKLMQAAGMVGRVRQEVAIHSRLKHPAVLELYTFFEDQNYVYLVLELCHNGELQRYLKEQGSRTLPESEAGRIIQQVVQGLLYLHSHQILHRDMSLSNLLLTRDMQVKIADFGLATQLSRPDEKHLTMCGTPNFISPEVATRSSHGLEADVWGLGCMLYTLLVGRPPFDTDAVKSTLTRVVMADYVMPSHLSENAKDLIDRLLKKNPKDRIRLRDIIKHPFITSLEKHRLNEKIGFARLSGDNIDSGLGRTLSSCGRPRMRSRSEERPSNSIHMMSNNTRATVLSEPLMELNSSTHGSHQFRYSDHQQYQEDSVLSGIPAPPPPRSSQVQLSHYSDPSTSGSRHQRRDVETEASVAAAEAAAVVRARSGHRQIEENERDKSEGVVEKLEVPPLSTLRLQPTRHPTKNAVFTISSNGEVCVEFFKRRNNIDRIIEVCRISGDGLRIILYKPKEALAPGKQPPPLPERGADSIYSYESLPSKHHRKYEYAARFISLVRAKTPKITLYTNRAKCFFMENGPHPDCEILFYDAVKVMRVKDVVKIVSKSGETYVEGEIPAGLEEYYDHYADCYKRCLLLESSLASLETATGNPFFPAIIGRRPTAPLADQIPITPPLQGKENVSRGPSVPAQLPSSFDATCSMVSTVNSQSRKSNSVRVSQTKVTKINVPGIGTAIQTPSGDIRVDYKDGSVLTVTPKNKGGGILYESPTGNVLRFNNDQHHNSEMPMVVRDKLCYLPKIVELLVSPTPRSIR